MEFLKKIGRHLPETPVICLLIAVTMVPCLAISGNYIIPGAGEVDMPYITDELQSNVFRGAIYGVDSVVAQPEMPAEMVGRTSPATDFTQSKTPDDLISTADEYDIPAEATSFKAWMSYRAITNKASDQWALQQDAWTDADGFRRYGDEGYYMVALGTYYASRCGKTFDITFEGGETIRCIVGDIKADIHTDPLHQHRNGNVVEFIVDGGVISKLCKRMGDMSYAKGANLVGKPTRIVACG